MTEFQLRHYSEKQLVLIDPEWEYPDHGSAYKPRGFWVSILGEYDWPWWFKEEQFMEDRFAVEHEVILKPEANILHLEGEAALDEFTIKYGVDRYGYDDVLRDRYKEINWPAVRADGYDGIIIAPYIWERRLELMWYYGWDCASGCIWNVSMIESIRPTDG